MTHATGGDANFVGSIPEVYERHLVPLIFQHYADDLASRVSERNPDAVLELACGTGVVTRALSSRLPRAAITATDLNPPMLKIAADLGTPFPTTFAPADAQALPFDDATFDVVVCQFGVMFFPDRPGAFAEMHRVLRPGGRLLFNVWDRLERNELAHCVNDAVGALFPGAPSNFMARVPHGYFDTERIRADVRGGGFVGDIAIDTIDARSTAVSADVPAVGFCQGTPFRGEIESRGVSVADATTVARLALVDRFGGGAIDAGMCAYVVTVDRS